MYTKLIFDTITENDESLFADDKITKATNTEHILTYVESKISMILQIIIKNTTEMNHIYKFIEVNQSLDTSIFEFFKDPLPRLCPLTRQSNKIRYRSELQRLMSQLSFTKISEGDCYVDENFQEYSDFIIEIIGQIGFKDFNKDDQNILRRIRYCYKETKGTLSEDYQNFSLKSTNFVTRFLEQIENFIVFYCVSANELINAQEDDYLKLFCFTNLHHKFVTSLSMFSGEFEWLDKIVNVEYGKSFPNDPKYPIFGVWKLALKHWNTLVLNKNYEELKTTSERMIDL